MPSEVSDALQKTRASDADEASDGGMAQIVAGVSAGVRRRADHYGLASRYGLLCWMASQQDILAYCLLCVVMTMRDTIAGQFAGGIDQRDPLLAPGERPRG